MITGSLSSTTKGTIFLEEDEEAIVVLGVLKFGDDEQ
jgi:hypothetical protein